MFFWIAGIYSQHKRVPLQFKLAPPFWRWLSGFLGTYPPQHSGLSLLTSLYVRLSSGWLSLYQLRLCPGYYWDCLWRDHAQADRLACMASLGTESGPHSCCENLTLQTSFQLQIPKLASHRGHLESDFPAGARMLGKPDGMFWQTSSSLKPKYGEQAEKRQLRNIHEEHKKVKCPGSLVPPPSFLPGQYITSVLAIFPLARAPFSSLFAVSLSLPLLIVSSCV